MKRIQNLEQILDIVRNNHEKKQLAVAVPHDPATLSALRDSYEDNIVNVLLVGDKHIIQRIAAKHQIDIHAFQIIHVTDPVKAVERTVQSVIDGQAHLIMKGSVPTSKVLGAVLHKGKELIPKGKILTHLAPFYSPVNQRLLIMTDAAVNINPTLARKVHIISNSIDAARKLGIAKPKVAVLTAVEKVNVTKMPVTGEAKLLEKMGNAGLFGNALIEGPLALDNAVSMVSARRKHTRGKVAGKADILVAPDIEAANILYKSIISFTDITMATVVVGARVPIVMPSRSDSEKTKTASIGLASFLSEV